MIKYLPYTTCCLQDLLTRLDLERTFQLLKMKQWNQGSPNNLTSLMVFSFQVK